MSARRSGIVRGVGVPVAGKEKLENGVSASARGASRANAPTPSPTDNARFVTSELMTIVPLLSWNSGTRINVAWRGRHGEHTVLYTPVHFGSPFCQSGLCP